MRIGYFNNTSYALYLDEFVFRHSAGTSAPTVPTRPYSGKLLLNKVGGYTGCGTSSIAATTISSDTQINSYGILNTITDSKTFTVSSWSNGTVAPAEGLEVMLHITAPISTDSANYPLVGLYAFAKIDTLNSTAVTLDREITIENGDDFTLNSSLLSTYYVQAIVVPLYDTLTVNSGKTISPLSWSTNTGGGIVAFRTTGNCTINGNILTHGKGAVRYDFQQITNSKLIDRFLCSQGGGIFIACGDTLTIPSTARLGASWSGAGDGSNGAAGYGGNGGDALPSSRLTISGGSGGVGGAGGGAVSIGTSYYANGGAAGSNGKIANVGSGGGGCGGIGGEGADFVYGTGGSGGGGQVNSGGAGGTGSKVNGNAAHGVNGGDTASYSVTDTNKYYSGAGGGAPGGNGGIGVAINENKSLRSPLPGGRAGANIILVCEELKTYKEALSTGGAAGTNGYESIDRQGASGGGGTGFCYIACGEQVN